MKQSMADSEAEYAVDLQKKRIVRRKILLLSIIIILITTAVNVLIFRNMTRNTTPMSSSGERTANRSAATAGSRDSGRLQGEDHERRTDLPAPLQAALDLPPSGTPSYPSGLIASKPPEPSPNETHVRIAVVTDLNGGTTDDAIVELFDNTGSEFGGRTAASLVLNKPGYNQPTDINTYDFIVPRPFCDMVGWRLSKPAKSSLDSPWRLKEIYIKLNGTLVYMDRTYGRDHPPVTADCAICAGNWARTESYKRSCGTQNTFADNQPSPSQVSAAALPVNRPHDTERGAKSSQRFEVPYRPYGNYEKRVIVNVLFNNHVTAPIAIDTGAPGTVISVRLAQQLGLFDEDKGKLLIQAGGIGGRAPAVRTIIDSMEVGGARLEFIPATVLMNSISDSFDGLLGLDFVGNYSVTVDANRRVVVFEEIPGDPERPGGRDRAWWTNNFAEFVNYRDAWQSYSKRLETINHVSMQATVNADVKRKEFADQQVREAEKLLDNLNHYASQQGVPTQWRRY